MSTQEQLLVQEIRAGKREAFEHLIQSYQNLVHHMISRMVKNSNDVEELCQETFLRVYAGFHQFRGESRLSTWIGRIAFTTATQYLRKKRIPILELEDENQDLLEELPIKSADLAEALSDRNMWDKLHQAISTLPALQRTMITLYYLDEISVEEISEIMDMPKGTVKSHMFRARHRLRVLLSRFVGVGVEI